MVDAMVEDHEIKRPMSKRLSRWVYRLLVFVASDATMPRRAAGKASRRILNRPCSGT
jgi:hypothetical protein